MCLCSVRFSFFSITPKHWLETSSPKWPILCRVGRKNLNSVNQSSSMVVVIAAVIVWFGEGGAVASRRWLASTRGRVDLPLVHAGVTVAVLSSHDAQPAGSSHHTEKTSVVRRCRMVSASESGKWCRCLELAVPWPAFKVIFSQYLSAQSSWLEVVELSWLTDRYLEKMTLSPLRSATLPIPRTPSVL